MARYCVEFDNHTTKFVVHEQSCTVYHDGYLLSINRASDLGEFPSHIAALKAANSNFPSVHPCSECFQAQR